MKSNDDINLIILLIKGAKLDTNSPLDAMTRLMEDAGLDSLALMELVEKLQVESGVTFLPEDYSVENFESVGSLLALMQMRRNKAQLSGISSN